MKTKNLLIIAVVVLLVVDKVQAIDVDFYHDAVIDEGDVYGIVNVYDTPPDYTTVDMTGGDVGVFWTYDSSVLNISGGEVTELRAHSNSRANILDGVVYSSFALDNATINFSGNARSIHLITENFGTVNVSGGTVAGLGVGDYGLANIVGGAIVAAWVHDSGILNISGGEIFDRLGAIDSSTVNIYGYDLVKTSTGGRYGYGQVSGFWSDDTLFTIDLSVQDTYSRINLIPEPATFILLALGSLLIKRKR